jgi:hypothetical protein
MMLRSPLSIDKTNPLSGNMACPIYRVKFCAVRECQHWDGLKVVQLLRDHQESYPYAKEEYADEP